MPNIITIFSPTTLANGGPFAEWHGRSSAAARSIMVVNNSIYTFWFEAASSIGLIIPPGNQCLFPLAAASTYRIYADASQPAPIAVDMNVTLTEEALPATDVIYTPLAPMNTQPGSSTLNPLYVTSTDPDNFGVTLGGNAPLNSYPNATILFTTPGMFGALTIIVGIILTVDTNGLVIFGSYQVPGPGNLPSVIYYEGFMAVGVPVSIPITSKGIHVGQTTTTWSAIHQVNGATLAWTVYGGV